MEIGLSIELPVGAVVSGTSAFGQIVNGGSEAFLTSGIHRLGRRITNEPRKSSCTRAIGREVSTGAVIG